MDRLRTTASIVLLGTLAGATAFAASPFDGTYSGAVAITKGNTAPRCERKHATVTIRDGHLEFLYDSQHNIVMRTDVRSDGTFRTTEQVGSSSRGATSIEMTGRIAGNRLESDVNGVVCGYHLSLAKS